LPIGSRGSRTTTPFVLAGGVDVKRANHDFNLQTVKVVATYRF